MPSHSFKKNSFTKIQKKTNYSTIIKEKKFIVNVERNHTMYQGLMFSHHCVHFSSSNKQKQNKTKEIKKNPKNK